MCSEEGCGIGFGRLDVVMKRLWDEKGCSVCMCEDGEEVLDCESRALMRSGFWSFTLLALVLRWVPSANGDVPDVSAVLL